MDILLGKKAAFVLLLYSLLFLLTGSSYASGSVEADLQELIDKKDMALSSASESVSAWINNNPEDALKMLLAKAKAPGVTDDDLAVYIWAMGLTKIPQAIDEIILLTRGKESVLLKKNTVFALSNIGGDRVPPLLLEQLYREQDKDVRYDIFNYLAQLQYKPVIPLAAELLINDSKVFYWYPVFVFGKLGDMAVPLLLEKAKDKDRNIRANALLILGHYLVAPEAVSLMQISYWDEGDPEIRLIILTSLERVTPNVKEIENFFKVVLEREKEEKLVQFAQETLTNLPSLEEHVKTYVGEKRVSGSTFAEEHSKLYRSTGKRGSYKVLAASSKREDELQLKKLREKILQRTSDEALYDYQEVNRIIIFNRLITTPLKEERQEDRMARLPQSSEDLATTEVVQNKAAQSCIHLQHKGKQYSLTYFGYSCPHKEHTPLPEELYDSLHSWASNSSFAQLQSPLSTFRIMARLSTQDNQGAEIAQYKWEAHATAAYLVMKDAIKTNDLFVNYLQDPLSKKPFVRKDEFFGLRFDDSIGLNKLQKLALVDILSNAEISLSLEKSLLIVGKSLEQVIMAVNEKKYQDARRENFLKFQLLNMNEFGK